MRSSPLQQLSDLGQSVWIDYLSRDLLETGELARLIDEDAVVGVTSNPTIFQRAIAGGSAYDGQLVELPAELRDPKEIFYELVACEVAKAS
jgi:transaldolase